MFDVLQLIGGLILALGYIPQIAQLIKTRSCRDLNLKTYLSLTVGIGLMEAYAINLALSGSGLMFAVTNTLSLLLVTAISIIIVCIRHHEKKRFRQPSCFTSNGHPYPLCIGGKNEKCRSCMLYEDLSCPDVND